MKTAIRSIVLTSILATGTAGAAGINVGGSPMLAQKDIIENAMNSRDHTTLVAAVKAAGLVDTLQGKGPLRSLPRLTPHLADYRRVLSILC